MNLADLRNTGRTTRMLDAAVAAAIAGRAVYVFVLETSIAYAHSKLNEAERLGVVSVGRFVDGAGIKIETMRGDTLDLQTMRMRGAHPNVVFFVDHAVIEQRYAAMLVELHRFDADDASPKQQPPPKPELLPPGTLERWMRGTPLAASGVERCTVIVDGGHTALGPTPSGQCQGEKGHEGPHWVSRVGRSG